MRVEQFVKVEIHDCEFVTNSASMGSALYVLNVEIPLLIINTSFVGNDGDGVIHLVNSKIRLENASISRNKGMSIGGLVLVNSDVKARNLAFSELYGTQSCVLFVGSDSNITFDACQVRETFCSRNMMDLSRDSSLLLISCTLSNLISEAHIIDIQAGRAIQTFSLYVKNITAATFLSAMQTSVNVYNSVFSEISGQVFASTKSTMFSISNSSLSNVNVNKTSLVSCSQAQVIELQGVRVTMVWTDQMGIYLEAREVWIEKCTFQAMLGAKFGALFLQDSKLNLSDSTFLSNQALAPNSKGGAISLSNSSAIITNCTFVLNSASIGGAIY